MPPLVDFDGVSTSVSPLFLLAGVFALAMDSEGDFCLGMLLPNAGELCRTASRTRTVVGVVVVLVARPGRMLSRWVKRRL